MVDDFSEGGAAAVVDNIIRGVSGSEFKHHVCCLDAVGKLGTEYTKRGLLVVCVGRSPGVDLGVTRKICKVIKENNINIIHAHQYTAYFYSLMSSFLMNKRPKLVYTEHGRHYPEVFRWKRAVINQVLHHFTHSFVAVSEAVKESLVKYEKLPAKKIKIVLNGIDMGEFSSKKRPGLSKELGLMDGDLVVATMSRLIEAKNHQMLIKAFPSVLEKVPNAKLMIVGDGEYRTELESLALECKIGTRVVFTGLRDDIKDILAFVDVLSLMSFYEGTSMTLLEGMAAGLPIVASNISGNKYLVDDNVSGFLIPLDEPGLLSECLVRLLMDKNIRSKMGREGKKNLSERFSREKMSMKYAEIYTNLLQKA